MGFLDLCTVTFKISEVKGYSSRVEHLRDGIKTIDFIGFEKRKYISSFLNLFRYLSMN